MGVELLGHAKKVTHRAIKATEYFGYNIGYNNSNMKVTSVIRYRNLFILVATFAVLCLSPLADIHFEGSTEERSYTHGRVHHELLLSLFIHELLFTHLQHTFDHVTLGVSHQTLQKSKILASKGTAFSSNTQTVLALNSKNIVAHSSAPIRFLQKDKHIAGIYSRKLSGLSPPNIFS